MRAAGLVGALLLLAAGALAAWGVALPEPAADRPWALIAILCLPGLLWAPGLGWALWLARRAPRSGLQLGVDSAWLGFGLCWIDVALARELGLRGEAAAWAQWALAATWAGLGLWLARGAPAPLPTPRRERVAGGLVALAVLGLALWKAPDLARPLDGHWYLEGADAEGREALALEPAEGWADARPIGWPEAGALELIPAGPTPTLLAPEGARGRVALAVRGPVGSRLRVGEQEVVVQPSVTEREDEGPVRRYLRAGVAGLMVDLSLAPGERLPLQVEGERVYLLPGTDAVWSLHAAGALRYVHYYQLLNQVENQVWAEEVLEHRWLTLNQPPGWSPLLATATLWVLPDLQAANALFLGVILLVGLSAVLLQGALAPGASGAALALPAAMTAAHGLLMIEPGSTNFPDNLFAASLIGLAGALATGRPGWFAGLGVAAGLLRYPGWPVALLFAAAWRLCFGSWPREGLRRFAGALAAVGVGAVVMLVLGHMEDVGFIVWFEIFPEHWHGDYHPSSLLPRIPEFYLALLRYSGGAVALACLGLLGPPSAGRQATRFLLGGFLTYSLVLCTIDHHPSHYFLPLVAMSGPALAAASTALPSRRLGTLLPILALVGVGAFLWIGQV